MLIIFSLFPCVGLRESILSVLELGGVLALISLSLNPAMREETELRGCDAWTGRDEGSIMVIPGFLRALRQIQSEED